MAQFDRQPTCFLHAALRIDLGAYDGRKVFTVFGQICNFSRKCASGMCVTCVEVIVGCYYVNVFRIAHETHKCMYTRQNSALSLASQFVVSLYTLIRHRNSKYLYSHYFEKTILN